MTVIDWRNLRSEIWWDQISWLSQSAVHFSIVLPGNLCREEVLINSKSFAKCHLHPRFRTGIQRRINISSPKVSVCGETNIKYDLIPVGSTRGAKVGLGWEAHQQRAPRPGWGFKEWGVIRKGFLEEVTLEWVSGVSHVKAFVKARGPNFTLWEEM